ncbi:uncharacterized protein G2W53_009850 [Senna tora]|uniref:Uncharacterized protein n=1 Tax=Senna tora TaxID=362788 RepID=A0A835CAM2_9FABA|nr:uncharacterized protein G2W53_009850 [Senna tora]
MLDMIHAPPMPRRLQSEHQTTPVSKIRPQFVVRNMLRHDPRSSHAKTTPIGASKPLRFQRSDPICRPNMLGHDPRSSHAKTTRIGASKPLRFANTTRTDVFDSLAQQVFCLVIREVRNMLRHDPRFSHAKTTPIGASKPLRHDPLLLATTTPIGASKPLRFANTTRTDVFDSLAQQVFCLIFVKVSEIRPRFVIRNMLGHDPRSSHAKTTPIGASKPLRFLRSDCDLLSGIFGHEPRSSLPTTPIGASKPLWFLRSDRDLSSEICSDMIHAPPLQRRLQSEHQNHSGSRIQREPAFDSIAQQVFCLVIREGLDPHSSHAKTTPTGAPKPLRFTNTTRTDVFDSLAQQVFCLVIREGFRDQTTICRPEYVKT